MGERGIHKRKALENYDPIRQAILVNLIRLCNAIKQLKAGNCPQKKSMTSQGEPVKRPPQ